MDLRVGEYETRVFEMEDCACVLGLILMLVRNRNHQRFGYTVLEFQLRSLQIYLGIHD